MAAAARNLLVVAAVSKHDVFAFCRDKKTPLLAPDAMPEERGAAFFRI
jgi:hypothetical protein